MNAFRKTLWFAVLLSVGAGSASFLSQYVLGMNPCVLCILQRLSVLAVGLVALIAASFQQQSLRTRTLSTCAVSIPAIYGLSVASYQIWLQSLPPGTAPACGAPWTFRLRDWPLFDIWEPVVRGFGNCAIPDYFLGIPLPIWSIAYFAFLLVVLWFFWFRTRVISRD